MKRIKIHSLLLISFAMLLLGAAPLSAQGTGEVTITWTAHSGFSDATLQIWYNVALLEVGQDTSNTALWQHKNTQALTITFTGLAVGTDYHSEITILGCTASEAANIEDGSQPSCTEFASGAANTVTAVASSASATATPPPAAATPTLMPLAMPTGLTTSGITPNSITLIWTKSAGASLYRVRKSASDSYTHAGDVATYTFTGLAADTQYTLEVVARNSQFQSAAASITVSTLPMTTDGNGNGGDGGDGDGTENCALAYSGSGGSGEIRVSWAARPPDALNSGATIWYCVHSSYESKATRSTSATFAGLEPGEEYGWAVDAFSCVGSETMAAGTCARITGDIPHASGSARASGRPQRATDGSSRSSGSSSSGSSSSSSAALPSAPSAPAASMIDHGVTVSGSANYQPVSGAGIGNAAVLAQGVVAATDVWGYVPAGTRVCFIARSGSGVAFLDAATAPRTLSWLNFSLIGGNTCVQLPGAGTVVLVGPGAPPPAPAQAPPSTAAVAAGAPPPPGESLSNSLCLIKLTDTLFLRLAPGGEIIGLVWLNSEVPVYEIVGEWYLVEFEGRLGYISRHSRQVLQGSC